MSYYIFKAMSAEGKTSAAMEAMKQYYGGMLSLGATTFWEDFDVEWLDSALPIDRLPEEGKTDVHREKGRYCYQGFRHSLCHGWLCEPIQFLFEEILGLKILEPGYKKIAVRPNLCGLNRIDAVLPTPYGELHIHVKNAGGRPVVKLKKPRRVAVVK